jgi:hypothetical protein
MSVIVPCFNHGATLRRALDSIAVSTMSLQVLAGAETSALLGSVPGFEPHPACSHLKNQFCFCGRWLFQTPSRARAALSAQARLSCWHGYSPRGCD